MSSETRQSGALGRGWTAIWLPIAFLGTAVALALNPMPFRSPVAAGRVAPDWATNTAPVRAAKMQPDYQLAPYTYRCSDCHRIIPVSPDVPRTQVQHREIQLQHGINARCFNCHHPNNRDAFVDDAGDEIPWNEPWRMCAKCHGPVYRDWQHGAHGRTNGYWDTSRGVQTRLRCIDCHDPHHPAFTSLEPAPGPNTLRMGRQDFGTHDESHDPLRLHSQQHAKDGRGD